MASPPSGEKTQAGHGERLRALWAGLPEEDPRPGRDMRRGEGTEHHPAASRPLKSYVCLLQGREGLRGVFCHPGLPRHRLFFHGINCCPVRSQAESRVLSNHSET